MQYILCGKTKRLKDMRCLNVPPEVMVMFVFMMSITPCAKMGVRNMIMGMMHIYNILASMSMVKNIMKTCSVTLTLPHSQPACSSFQCPIWKYSFSFEIQQKKFWNSSIFYAACCIFLQKFPFKQDVQELWLQFMTTNSMNSTWSLYNVLYSPHWILLYPGINSIL